MCDGDRREDNPEALRAKCRFASSAPSELDASQRLFSWAGKFASSRFRLSVKSPNIIHPSARLLLFNTCSIVALPSSSAGFSLR